MRKRISLAILALLIMIMPVGVAAASDVSNALYNLVITVANADNTTTHTNVVTTVAVSSANLISGGYANAGLTNIALRSSTGADIPFMPGYGTDPMCLFVSSIAPNSYIQDLLYTAESTGGTTVYFPGAAGMTVTDNASLEPAALPFRIDIKGVFLGPQTGGARYLLSKALAINIFYAAAVDNQIIAQVYPGPVTLTIDGVTTGLRTVSLVSDAVNITLSAYDSAGALIDTDSVAAVNVTNNANDWVSVQNGAVVYMEYYRYNINNAAVSYWDWNYGLTFTDNVSSVIATPSLRITTSEADVTATAGEFTIINPAEASPTGLIDPSDWYTTPTITGATFQTGTITPTFPGAPVINAIATATSTPSNLPFSIITGSIILIISLSLSFIMRRGGSGSLIVKMVVISGLMGVAVATGIFDLWMVIIFLMCAIPIAMASQQRGWG